MCRNLGSLIRNNNDTSGIIIGGVEYNLSQYADDILIIVDGCLESMDGS